MPKTIETLKRPYLKDDVLHSHIADTYFYQKTRHRARKKKVNPLVKAAKELTKYSIPFAIAVAMVAAYIFVRPALYEHYTYVLKNKTAAMKIINLVNRGRVNKEVIKNLQFMGYANRIRRPGPGDAVGFNSPKKYNWADISVNFRFPIDVSTRSLSLSMKGRVGGERVNIILRDTQNRSIMLRELYLSSDWKDESLQLDWARSNIDLKNITAMRIEYGRIGESAKELNSPIDITIFLKNMCLPKEEIIKKT